ncbi:MAG: hypothetical protein KIS85_00005, partial [Anaerolineales bacterium]|nr:hypothetical protein [Anaerolineales bacterium]
MPKFGLPAQKTPLANKLIEQIIHFGSLWEITAGLKTTLLQENFVVGTIFHGIKEDPSFQGALTTLLERQEAFTKLHTASSI